MKGHARKIDAMDRADLVVAFDGLRFKVLKNRWGPADYHWESLDWVADQVDEGAIVLLVPLDAEYP